MHGLKTVTAGVRPEEASGHILGFNCTACGFEISANQARKAEGCCRACKRAGRTHESARRFAAAAEKMAALPERAAKQARSVAPEVFA